ncbi:MAG: hypothetical protein H6704_31585 [Myxococcales bacterium]|nr:hypothetical protein [Myxococcales bacterium]
MRKLTRHAARRTAQRRIRPQHIELTLEWGREIRQADGRVAYHLGYREAAWARSKGVLVSERAVGVTVVVARDGAVLTVLRSPDRRRLVRVGSGRWRPIGGGGR